MNKTTVLKRGVKYSNADKVATISVKNIEVSPLDTPLAKPDWIRIRLPTETTRIKEIKSIMRARNLHSVCEEAACPNLAECFHRGTATFMILGAICTRRCPFCDVGFGKPLPPDTQEPLKLAQAISAMQLQYVVITSVDRDDLNDGGAAHFVDCITEIRRMQASIKIEILVPDFKGKIPIALKTFEQVVPDVFNHNVENVPRLYRQIRPAASYQGSLTLLSEFNKIHPSVPTKSGLMVGLGETNDEIIDVMHDLRQHNVSMLTLGQYLQPSRHHYPVQRYVSPDEFALLKKQAISMGFTRVAAGALVRSSYHADRQTEGIEVK